MATSINTLKISPREVMTRAWALMRTRYDFGRIPFRSIGRACLAWCVRESWRLARAAARLAASTVGELAARIALVKTEIARAAYADSFTGWHGKATQLEAELAQLRATARDAGLQLVA